MTARSVKGVTQKQIELPSYEEAAKRLRKRDAKRLQREYTHSSTWDWRTRTIGPPSWAKVASWAKKNMPDVGRPWDPALCIIATNRFLNWR